MSFTRIPVTRTEEKSDYCKNIRAYGPSRYRRVDNDHCVCACACSGPYTADVQTVYRLKFPYISKLFSGPYNVHRIFPFSGLSAEWPLVTFFIIFFQSLSAVISFIPRYWLYFIPRYVQITNTLYVLGGGGTQNLNMPTTAIRHTATAVASPMITFVLITDNWIR